RWRSGGFRAARLLLCRLAWTPPPGVFPGCGSALAVGLRTPVHLLICFWRYFRWLTFRLDLTGLSRASLMLLEAESMKLSRSRVVSRYPPPSSSSSWWGWCCCCWCWWWSWWWRSWCWWRSWWWWWWCWWWWWFCCCCCCSAWRTPSRPPGSGLYSTVAPPPGKQKLMNWGFMTAITLRSSQASAQIPPPLPVGSKTPTRRTQTSPFIASSTLEAASLDQLLSLVN
uniref:Uncharacterized protein n=1 Tax=Gadus morhua TaxID=8049 RepID=A0A8C5CEH3_GADMO